MEPLRPTDPRSVGDHQVIARLGEGGMGQVFLGTSPGGRPVAIKVVRPALAAEAGFRERFRREVEAARTVSGAFTAPVVEADPVGPVPWLATAYLPGLSLLDLVRAHGPLPPPAVRALGAALAEALVAVHRAGIAHRDLKPSNVMITPQGVRVIDFGIAKAADGGPLTQSGQLLGTPGYLAPEQAAGGAVGPATDVFALAAVLCFAATAVGPFGVGDVPLLLHRTFHEEPDLTAVADPGLRDLIAAGLHKNPAQRPTPAWLLSALARPEDGLGWLPAPLADVVLRQAALRPPAPATAPSPPYAPWGRRLAAALLDGLFIVLPILCYVAYLMAFVWGRENITVLNRGVAISTIRATVPIVALACLITFFVLLVRTLVREGRTGQSPGKRLLRIELLDARTGRPVGIGRALVRRLAHVLDSLPCYLGFLWPLWDEQHQTFADKLAGTVVLDRPGPAPGMGG
ncbi:hypothetical protein GCM10023191_097360 [Actinoallomurus oryzae]|uniref:Protein kinase domain-containing protein n=1 Tax=Actinoallomurus oryzae TaxID=502180 RepID=A0ABP8R7M1_9ACTN